MECKKEDNLKGCTCTYSGCPRRGICREGVFYHSNKGGQSQFTFQGLTPNVLLVVGGN